MMRSSETKLRMLPSYFPQVVAVFTGKFTSRKRWGGKKIVHEFNSFNVVEIMMQQVTDIGISVHLGRFLKITKITIK